MSVRLFKSLLYKSSHLQQEIDHEQRKRWPDYWRLLKLKKLRLRINDRLARLYYALSSLAPQPDLVPVQIRKNIRKS